MDLRTRWQRLDAVEWVHRIGVAQTLLCAVWLTWTCWVAVAAEVPVLVVIPAAVLAASGWFTAAWRGGSSWTWWIWTVWAGLWSVSGIAGALLAPGWPAFVPLLYGGGLLLLLCHPGSRARIGGPAVDRRQSHDPAAPWIGSGH